MTLCCSTAGGGNSKYLVALALIVMAGCGGDAPPSDVSDTPTAPPPRTSVALRVLVVNEPELAEAIGRLEGEWAEQFGGSLSAEAKSWPEVAAAEPLDADVILFPSCHLGELCTRDRLRPVRSNVLEDAAFDADDIFPVVHRELITWGGRVMALPLGVDVAAAGDSFDDRPGIRLLVEAAPAIASADRDGDLFDPRTMHPRIAEPAFADALVRLASDRPLQHSVPVLGMGDRLAAVTASSRNAATAFKLLGWLATAEISSQLARAGSRTMPVRRSLASSLRWHDPALSAAERNELGNSLDQLLGGDRCLVIPRIPGINDYLAALNDAVKSALVGDVEPQAALDEASARWDVITDKLGRESQRDAYFKHLGIAKP